MNFLQRFLLWLDDKRWERTFKRHPEVGNRLEQEAVQAIKEGNTKPLNLEDL